MSEQEFDKSIDVENTEAGVDTSELSVVEVATSKTVDGEKAEATTYMPVGDNLDELTSIYGEDIVFEYAIRQLKVRMQAQVRSDLEAFLENAEGAEAPESLTEKYKGWKPQVQRTKRKNPKEDALKAAESLSPEELQALISELSAKTAE